MTEKGNKYCPLQPPYHSAWYLCREDECMLWDSLKDDCSLNSLSRCIEELGESLERSFLHLQGR